LLCTSERHAGLESWTEAIRQALALEPDVVFAYLFGSFASAAARLV
jgi:predicted nucleotidyltransferase